MTVRLLLIGDAGTGKTYYLYNKAKEFDECVFVSHTNAAINEFRRRDRDRAIEARTLHSLCLSLVRKRHGVKVMDDEVRATFCEKVGLHYDPNPYVHSPAKEFFSLHSLYVNLTRPPLDRFCEHYKVDYEKFSTLLAEYEKFKRERGYVDFEDMLELALQADEKIHTQAVIVDEAQDLSPLQWKVIDAIFEADILIAAGDDMQSIFSFQGARPELFLSFSNRVKVLKRNYRIPKKLWDFAGLVIKEQLRRERSKPVDESKEGTLRVLKPTTFEEAVNYVAAHRSGLVVVRHNRYCLLLEELFKKAGVRVNLVKRDGFNWNAINIDTVHAVKGMEHERVFVLDAVRRASHPEEEDRIWYTALTRAKRELHVVPILGETNWVTSKLPEDALVQELTSDWQKVPPARHSNVTLTITVHAPPHSSSLVAASAVLAPPPEVTDPLASTACTPPTVTARVHTSTSTEVSEIPNVAVTPTLDPPEKKKEKGILKSILSIFRKR
ncbi:UvrD-helicase domain-containing protein [Archaeoglobus neptunius]|uniref:UvrD-helicase domain-containing protein n=1 Tax=Archaeoglobus neptunius TaxID=2798580 RepID=UPI001927B98A|nr:UvrD-helicase domain-containing protein [Archaeoglobus neptunius]